MKKRQLVNREISLKDRRFFLEKSIKTLNLIVNSYSEWITKEDFLIKLEKYYSRFLNDLYKARHFTYISVGGDLEHIADHIELSEKLFVNLIETIYSMARYLERFISHQNVLRKFRSSIAIHNYKHQRYLEQIIETDNNSILRELNTILMRMNMFQKFI